MIRENKKCLVAILNGGKSSRFGSDKSKAFVYGLPMLDHTIVAARSVADRIIVVGRKSTVAASTGAVAFVPDDMPGHLGPIAGIITALRFAAENECVLALACDMPLLTTEALVALRSAHCAASNSTVATFSVIEEDEGMRLEPLFSVYTRAMLPTLEAAVQSGRRSLQQFVTLPHVNLWHVPRSLRHPIRNANTPEDLDKLINEAKSAG